MNENRISAIIGGIIIIVIGVMVVNYFRNLRPGTTTPTGTNTEATPTTSKKYVVQKGDTLWSIAEKEYKDGFRWTEIKEANALKTEALEEGQELTIPNIEIATATILPSPTAKASATAIASASAAPAASPVAAVTPAPTVLASAQPTVSPTPAATPATGEKVEQPKTDEKITGDTYTVVKGDNLWTIAEKAYGDGYKWVDIARANKLVNPSIIHAGNTFSIPR